MCHSSIRQLADSDVDAGVLANSVGTAREFDSEITLRWKSLKTRAILCGWVLGTEFATGC
jgi:hypothetical protein